MEAGMPMISYAQNAEDVLLHRAFPEGTEGFYIDVGANDPVFDSVTKHFYDRGWHGINIEPQGRFYERLCAARPRDINLQIGLSYHEGTHTFYEVPARDGWSTFSVPHAEAFRQAGLQVIPRALPLTTLARLCERYVDRPIQFLKIDVEGYEREVVAGADWQRWRPQILIIEAAGHEDWERPLLAADYLYATFDGINRFYVSAEQRHLLAAFATPVNSLDDFRPHRYAHLADLSPTAVQVARRLDQMAGRFPRLAAVVQRLFRMAG
jgi:FkbM family methyltransferase